MTGKGTGKRLSETDVEQIKKLDEEGHTRKYICETLGVGVQTVRRYLGNAKKYTEVTPDMILKMHDLRDNHNLSNAQIGLELGVATSTVAGYLGPQKKGCRSPYGSIVAHADGESFVPDKTSDPMPGFMPLSKRVAMEEAGVYIPPKPKDPVLTMVSEEWTKSLKGKKYSYKLIYDGKDTLCVIRETLTGDEMVINANDLNDMFSELLALKEYIPQK